MKKFLYLAVICLLASISPINAITRVVNVSEIEGELTRALRQQVQGLTYNDSIIINFDKIGTDTICGTITAHCNVIMAGQGRCKSTVILENGTNQQGFIAFNDDSFFVFRGTSNHNISVSITDLSFKLMEHNGIWWESAEKHAVKIYHANGVTINNVDSYLKNAVCTNFDLRVCSNVTVTNCNIVNYNNCLHGGCLWLRGAMHDINITGNNFYKYGNDEALAFFSHLIDADTNTSGNVTRNNIIINDNNFFYKYDGEDKADIFNDMQFSLFSGDDSPYSCATNNFMFSNNRFQIDDLVNRTIAIRFNNQDTFSNVEFNNNTFINNYIGSIKRYYRNDIEVYGNPLYPDTVFFRNNVFKNYNPVVNPYNDNGAAYFLVQGSRICLDGNILSNFVTNDTAASTDIGVTLVWCGVAGGEVTLRNNMSQNLKNIARIAAGNGISKFKLVAEDNTVHGDTKIYCNAIDTLNLDFRKNLFMSNSMSFFLQEFAATGSLVFNENNVFVKTNGGQLMAHWNSAPTSTMRFNRLEVRNNLLRGVNSTENMLKNITNVGYRLVNGNICIQNP